MRHLPFGQPMNSSFFCSVPAFCKWTKTCSKSIILVHELIYRRHNNRNVHVRGYKEEGTITTPFDVRVQNEVDRFHLVQEALKYLPMLGNRGAYLYQRMSDKLVEHKQYIHEYGVDLPEVAGWKWEK